MLFTSTNDVSFRAPRNLAIDLLEKMGFLFFLLINLFSIHFYLKHLENILEILLKFIHGLQKYKKKPSKLNQIY